MTKKRHKNILKKAKGYRWGRKKLFTKAKEAVIKALLLPGDSWLDIRIKHDPAGAPRMEILHQDIKNYSLSISHDGNYVVAQYTALVEE